MKRGVFNIEYAFMMSIMAVVLTTMGVYGRRALSGKWREAGDMFSQGRQYEPGKTQIMNSMLPVLWFAVNPTNIQKGQSVTFSWGSRYATSCTAWENWNAGGLPTGGSAIVIQHQEGYKTVTMACDGPAGRSNIEWVAFCVEPTDEC